MIKIITATERHEAKVGDWLTSNYLFSFADYYDPSNVQFGPLRVFNDDHIGPKGIFSEHPHAEMEIITVVLDGAIKHTDSLGNETTIKAGQVQRMTAGTGITHAESNAGEGATHLYQLWFLPNKRGLAPSYEQMDVDFLDSKNKLIPLATGQKVLEDVVFMNSNSTVYYGNFKEGHEFIFQTFKIRKTLIYVTEGDLLVNNVELEKHDQIRLEDQDIVTLHANSDTSFMLIDVPATEANY
ncbi:pirin family protein [Pontibacter liquoris]|uniref:pirin family protein n=1 Tax=Pontibacter liquoris TaxID=2905677 RepID=UPI001FA77F15|nr:pirin family protein [Pontibacter liquoris]